MAPIVENGLTLKPYMSERRVSIVGALLVAVGPVGMSVFIPAMPDVVRAMNTTETFANLTLTLYFAGFAFAMLIVGPLSDALGRKPITLAFTLLFCSASLLALLAPTIEILILARFLQGIGASVGMTISRALIRDTFTGEHSARIMNLMSIIIALAPAMAPIVGGVLVTFLGWRSVFYFMIAAGIVVILVSTLATQETVKRDLSRLNFADLLASYWDVLSNRYFLASAAIIAGTIGAVYANYTFLPFILIERVGMSKIQFGLAMLSHPVGFFLGSLIAARLLRSMNASRLIPVGTAFLLIGAFGLALMLIWEPTALGVMLPIACYSFGISFVLPATTTAAFAPFKRNAGAASAMLGFVQMGSGLLFGTIGAVFGDPVRAISIVIPVMALISTTGFLVYQRLPEEGRAAQT